MKKIIIPIIVLLIAIFAIIILIKPKTQEAAITNFEECAIAGNPIMESYPRQCAANGRTFTEEIPGVTDMDDMIRVSSPQPNGTIKSPLVVKGEARGGWFFEATFPVTLTNWDGIIIAEGYAQVDGEWMTEEFVPFTANLTFTKPTFNNRGFLILKKANASGLPEHDAALEIPIYFEGVAPQGGNTSSGGNTATTPTPSSTSTPPPDEPVFCTADAMQCPDGSYVGRQGPRCEFAPCPGN